MWILRFLSTVFLSSLDDSLVLFFILTLKTKQEEEEEILSLICFTLTKPWLVNSWKQR
jgi:hypothetical protein